MQFSVLIIGALAALAQSVVAAPANATQAVFARGGLPGCAQPCFGPHSGNADEARAKCQNEGRNKEIKQCVMRSCKNPFDKLATLNYAKSECKAVGVTLRQ